MQPIIEWYRWLDRRQSTRSFRIAASIVALIGCAAVFGSLLATSYSLERQRMALEQALTGQNLNRGDLHAISLQDTGTVVLNDRTYGGARILRSRMPIFDADGNVFAPVALASALVADQVPGWTPEWLLERPGTMWMLAIAATMWFALIIWLGLTLPFVLTVAATGAVAGALLSAGMPQTAMAVGGIGVLTFTFLLLSRGALLLLNRPSQTLAVAHTTVKEASRTRLSLVFIVLLLVILPLLPLTLDSDSPLRFQVQTYISRSLGLTFAIAAVMTLFLSCASVAFEIRDRQIWQLVTKPLNHFNYLLGKWTGVMVVNLIILVVAGVSTFTFIQYLSDRPTPATREGVLDALAVSDEVLTARIATRPEYDRLEPEILRQRVDQVLQNDPRFAELQTVPLQLRQSLERDLQNAHSVGQRTLGPGRSQIYEFKGLGAARNIASTLTLRYRFHILRDDEHEVFPAGLIFIDKNDQPLTQPDVLRYVPTMNHTQIVPPELIQEDGTLRLVLVNLHQPDPNQRELGALNFEERDFELLYKVASFEGNFLRAILTTWIKLAFLAALGVCCATFLNFPVACLLSFTVLIAAVLGPYLAEALYWYEPYEADKVDWANIGQVITWLFEWFTFWVGTALVFMLSSFGSYRPTQNLVEGKLIEWMTVFEGLGRLVVLWSGFALIIGYLVMRNRQLAIYSGHG